MNISPPAKMLTNASPPQPPQKLAELRSPQKANVQAVAISKRPEGLYFLMTPCSLRSLLSVQAYYTSFGACKCKSTYSSECKSSERLRKVSFDLKPAERLKK
jgi:hypothetical protein